MKKILTLMLIAFTLALLASCGGGDGGGELNVDFNARRDILTTDMTEEELREYLTVVYTEDDEADGREVSDYTVSCAFTEGLCTAAVSYKNETEKFTAFFFDPTKLVTEGDFLFYDGYKNQNFLLRYTGEGASLILPERDGNYVIFDEAFLDNTSLTEISLGNSVTKIGACAFSGCTALTRVSIGNKLTDICNGAFTACRALRRIDVPSLTSWCKITFNCTGETNAVDFLYKEYDGSVGSGDLIFSDVLNGNGSFVGSTNISGSSGGISGSVTIVPDSGITSGSSFVAVTVSNPYNVESLATNLVQGKESIVKNGALYLIEEDGSEKFVRELYVSNPLYFAKSLYVDGAHLTELTVPDEITIIQSNAFFGSDITKVTLHGGIKIMGRAAFALCDSLSSFSVEGVNESTCSILAKAFASCNFTHLLTEYENGLYLGNADNPYLLFVRPTDKASGDFVINPKTAVVMQDAFNHLDKSQFSSVSTGEGVRYIGANAFGSLTGVAVNIAESVKYVAARALIPVYENLTFEATDGWYYTNKDGDDSFIDFTNGRPEEKLLDQELRRTPTTFITTP